MTTTALRFCRLGEATCGLGNPTIHTLVGGSPLMSNGSLWTAPDLPGRLKAFTPERVAPTCDVAADDIRGLARDPRRGAERLLDLLFRSGPYGDGSGDDPEGLTPTGIESSPHGVDLRPLEPRVPAVLTTPSGRIELAPPALVEDLPSLRGARVAVSGMP